MPKGKLREGSAVDAAHDAWREAGKRLRELEPDEFDKILELARIVIAAHDEVLDDEAVFRARLDQLLPGRVKSRA